MKSESTIEERIEKVLDTVRPYLKEDNGGVEFVNFEQDTGVVELRLTGNCKECPLLLMTLRGGIERFILRDIPEAKRVEAVK